jgi:PAS domain S-box-containing protein
MPDERSTPQSAAEPRGGRFERARAAVRTMRPPRLPTPLRWLCAPASVAFAALFQWSLLPRPSIAPFSFTYVGVAVAAWLGGRVPGLLAAALAVLVANYVFLEPPFAWSTGQPALWATAMFALGATPVALLCAALRDAIVEADRRADLLRRHTDLMRLSHDAILVWRWDGPIESWNRGAEELYGYGAAEAEGRVSHELLRTVFPVSLAAVEAALRREGRWEGRLVHRTKDGRAVIVAARFQLVCGHDGVERVLETNRDLSERERAERAREESEARLRAVIETAADAIITIDERGVVGSFNAAAERMFGYLAGEVVGSNVSMLVPEHLWSEHDGYLARYLRTGERRVVGAGREVMGRRKDGEVFPLDLAVSESIVAGHRLFTGILRDVSERRRLDAEREALLASERAARSEAERAARMRDEFVATVSHELRTPLNAILGWSTILRDGVRDPETLKRALAVIERNARAQAQLVEDLLDMSRILSGKLRFEVKHVDLAGVVENAVATVQPAAEAKGVRLVKGPLETRAAVQGDPSRLEQVVINLLSNAIKFTPKGGAVSVSLGRAGSRAEIAVRDTGQGIDPELLPHVFDRYRQGDSSITRKHAGLGIGLALVKHIAEQHGGEVRAESAGEGKGATFVVSLPVAAARREEGPTPLDACASLDGVRVLVADDDADARDLVRRVLSDCGAEVTAVGSASEVVQELPRYRPDVLVSDIGMPEMDGYELMCAVRSLPPERGGKTPAVALTAFGRPEDRLRALRVGYQMHLAKPVDQAELLVVVANLAGRISP